MRLSDSLDKLDAALASAGLPAARKQYPAEALAPIKEVFGEEILTEIEASGYPGGVIVPWAAEDFELYSLEEIISRQDGYRTDARTGAVSSDWPDGLHVFAEASANPFAIGHDGPIHFARHGMGSWRFDQVAPDLATFLNVVAEWVSFFVVENNSNIVDDDFEVRPEKLEEIRNRVLSGLDEKEKASFIKALGV